MPLTAGLGRLGIGRGVVVAGLAVVLALAAALLPIELAAAAVGGLIALGVIAVRPAWGLALLAFSVPYESLRQVPLGGFNAGSTEALVALTGLGWGLHTLAFRRPIRLPALGWPVLLLIGFGGLSATVALQPLLSLKELVKWLELLVVWVVGQNVLTGRRAGLGLVAALLAAGASEALIGLAQFFLRLGPEAYRFGPFLRAFGTFSQPNPFGGYLISVLPLALALTLFGWRAWRAGAGSRAGWLVPGAATVLVAAALAMTLSRGAWLGFGVAALVVLSLWDPRTLRAIGLLAIVAALVSAAGIANLLPGSVSDRLANVVQYFGVFDVRTVTPTAANWAIVERMAHWQSGADMFIAHPWTGVGPGNYPAAYPDYQYHRPHFRDPLGHAHNLYLNFLAETGLPGFAAYTAFVLGALIRTGRQAVAAARTSPPGLLPRGARGETSRLPSFPPSPRGRGAGGEVFPAAVAAGVFGGLLAMAVHNLFDNLTVHGLTVQVALLLALVYAQPTPPRTVRRLRS